MSMKFCNAQDVPPRSGSKYPLVFQQAVQGRSRRALGDMFELTQFGVNLTTLEPGAMSAQRHWHETEDEFILVMEGELVLVDDAGEHPLQAGMCAGFKAGVANGHCLINRSSQPARYLEVGSRLPDDYITYPDIDMVCEAKDNKYQFLHKDGTAY